jgi:hypothetical protein
MNDTRILQEAEDFFNTCLIFHNFEDVWTSSSNGKYDFNVYDMRARLEPGETLNEPPINCDILEIIAMEDGSLEYNTVHSFPTSDPFDDGEEELFIHKT